MSKCFWNDSDKHPVAPVIFSITVAFTFHMFCIAIPKSLYCNIFSALFSLNFYQLV
jgi:hypothetical protein